MRTHWKLYLGALLTGAVGIIAVLLALHLWNDHAQHHAVWDLEVQRAQAQRAQQASQALQPPAPSPPAPAK